MGTRGTWRKVIALGPIFLGVVALSPHAPRVSEPLAAPEPRSEEILANSGVKGSATPNEAEASAVCAEGMIEIDGEYCPVVEQYCREHVDPKAPMRDRCADFRPTGRCFGKPVKKHFCIDTYEWPNKRGQKPLVGVTWDEAKRECAAIGKRLCKDTEWTLACEGAERLPYPYGYRRNPEACNIDRTYIMPDDNRFANKLTRAAEIARLDQSDAAGAREGCVSPYGVHDTTGNADEWVHNELGKPDYKPYVSGLKGGYWGPVRNRCRAMTVDHNIWHSGYQIGFRCCTDVRARGVEAPRVAHGSGGT